MKVICQETLRQYRTSAVGKCSLQKSKKKRNSRFGWKSPSWWVKSTQYIKFNEGVNCPLSYNPYYIPSLISTPLPVLYVLLTGPWTSPFLQAEYLCLIVIRNKST